MSLFNTLKILFNTCRPAFKKGNCTPYQKITYLKVVNHFFFLQSNVYILKQIVQRTQKWHWSF